MTNFAAGAAIARTEASASGTAPLYSRNRALAFTGPVQLVLAHPVAVAALGAASVCRCASPPGEIVSLDVEAALPLKDKDSRAPLSE